MIVYLAVSADTTSGQSAYAYKIENLITHTEKHSNSTGPRELLRGMISAFDYMIKEGYFERVSDIIFITNNQFITKMINDDQISLWHDSNWIKTTGEPVASVDLLKQIYNYVQYFKERDISLFMAKPVNAVEEATFKNVSKIALNKRKFS